MNVEIGTGAAQFPEKEYLNSIFLAVQRIVTKSLYRTAPTAPPYSILNGHLSCSVLTAQDSPKKAAVDLTWLLQSTTGITPSEIILGVTQTVIRGNVVAWDSRGGRSVNSLIDNMLTADLEKVLADLIRLLVISSGLAFAGLCFLTADLTSVNR